MIDRLQIYSFFYKDYNIDEISKKFVPPVMTKEQPIFKMDDNILSPLSFN